MPEKTHIETTFVVVNDALEAETVAVTDTFWTDLDDKYGNFAGSSLISSYSFIGVWPTWEVHPAGDEFVCLLLGKVEMILALPRRDEAFHLSQPGEFLIVPKGIWHTAKVAEPSTLLFVAPGQGTENSIEPERRRKN